VAAPGNFLGPAGWSPTVLPSARAKGASSTSRPCILRQLQRHASAPDGDTDSAASAPPGVCAPDGGHLQCRHLRGRKSQQHLQTLHLWRQMQLQVVAPVVVTYSAPSRTGERACGICSPYILGDICGAWSSSRRWSPAGLPAARVIEPAASADLTSLAAAAAPCRRAGWGHPQRGHQRVRKS